MVGKMERVTPLLNGLDMPANAPRYQGGTFTGEQEQFWPDVLPDTTSDWYER